VGASSCSSQAIEQSGPDQRGFFDWTLTGDHFTIGLSARRFTQYLRHAPGADPHDRVGLRSASSLARIPGPGQQLDAQPVTDLARPDTMRTRHGKLLISAPSLCVARENWSDTDHPCLKRSGRLNAWAFAMGPGEWWRTATRSSRVRALKWQQRTAR
jgi:hypothetical protein